ncbi:Osmotin thaumatin-like protein [Venturia nashicola]|uniref:Osmotin thaumatin-like protein n=1 Tax=Venturia nashicola TaxID=86259 RepID=A0A4Z1P0F7_9PEZI|nr:Osmotin thaumatin-like protein [Venturia nashicola]
MSLRNFMYHASWILPVANAAGKTEVPLLVTNSCRDTVWPGLFTSGGTGPETMGFELTTGSTRNLSVLSDWNGRIWGRTNCTFDGKGVGSCGTGACGTSLVCSATGETATLAEFNLEAHADQSFYDISLVDGYNLPMAIQIIPTNGTSVPPSNETNLICAGSLQGFDPNKNFNPYNTTKNPYYGTTSTHPLSFDTKMSQADISHWCPWDLQFHPVEEVGNTRPPFDPCLSLCTKTGKPEHCCTGKKHNSAKTCKANYYSKRAKAVCPDAYSFAYDDDSSTFTVPTGTGFEVVFCPVGRSTVIKKTLGGTSGARSLETSLFAILAGVLIALWFS